MTAGDHSAQLPDCVARGCLTKSDDGHVGFNLGAQIHTTDKRLLVEIPEKELSEKLKKVKEVLKPKSKKRELVVTPSKTSKSKRRLRMSTPRYSVFRCLYFK